MQNETPSAGHVLKEESQLVTFLLKDQEFGFDIMSVQEIIRVPKMAKVPCTPQCVEGIANLRGVILPVIDVRTRFGLERSEDTDSTRVLVIDLDGVKTGLRVDRVKQVTRVLRGELEPPPAAIRGVATDYLDGVVKLDNGKRILMALNAGQVCQLDTSRRKNESQLPTGSRSYTSEPATASDAPAAVHMVTFRIGGEEFGFRMEHVREILRVRTPQQVPDAPDYVLGVLTVRGRVLPIIDLRKLLQRRSVAEDCASECREVRESYERWLEQLAVSKASRTDRSAAERLRVWISCANSSSQVLIETLSRARGVNEKLLKKISHNATTSELKLDGADVIAALRQFEKEVAANVHEDQRIIVLDVNGFVFGLVVDRVNEVMSVARNLLEPPPIANSRNGVELEAVAKANSGKRLILLIDVNRLIKSQKGTDVRSQSPLITTTESMSTTYKDTDISSDLGEVQLVTFTLGEQEYGVPISKIKEIERFARITKVPNALRFFEGVANLRGEVFPVLDTRKRLDLAVREYDDRTRIIIVEFGGAKTGLIVDSVREVLRLSTKDIAPAPDPIQSLSQIDQRFVSGIAKVGSGNRMVVLLDVEKILTMEGRTEPTEVQSL